MNFFRVPFSFHMGRLRRHFLESVSGLAPVIVGGNYGGWSVLSATGSYKDGWVESGMTVDASSVPADAAEFQNWVVSLGIGQSKEHFKATEICTGYLNEIVQEVRSFDVEPSRARIVQLVPAGETIWHRDAPQGIDAYRLHIPIFTNDQCFFEYENEKVHMPADGSGYVVKVNHLHRAVNFGKTSRLHLIMDVLRPENLIRSSHLGSGETL